MGFTTAADTTDQAQNNQASTGTEPGFEEIKEQVQSICTSYQEIKEDADQIKEALRAGSSTESIVSDKAALIQAARNHGHTIKEIYPSEPETLDLEIQSLNPQMFSVDIEAQVTEVQSTNKFDGGKVRSLIIEDDTGRTQLTAWDEDVKLWNYFREGDWVVVEGGYTNQEISDYQRDRFGVPAVHVGDSSIVRRDRGGETKMFDV